MADYKLGNTGDEVQAVINYVLFSLQSVLGSKISKAEFTAIGQLLVGTGNPASPFVKIAPTADGQVMISNTANGGYIFQALTASDIQGLFTADNIIQGDNITVTKDGNGNVTISSTGGGTSSADNLWTESTASFNVYRRTENGALKFGALVAGTGVNFDKTQNDMITINADGGTGTLTPDNFVAGENVTLDKADGNVTVNAHANKKIKQIDMRSNGMIITFDDGAGGTIVKSYTYTVNANNDISNITDSYSNSIPVLWNTELGM
jgi:hypothetical protein